MFPVPLAHPFSHSRLSCFTHTLLCLHVRAPPPPTPHSNAAKPSRGLFSTTSYNPNMAVKCFADGVTPSGNLQTIWTIDGFDVLPEDSAGKPAMKDSCSFFDVCLLHTAHHDPTPVF